MKKMKREGYESQHDINSVHYKDALPLDNQKESFENTRKSYYFGVHEMSPGPKPKGKSAKKGKSSPSKSEASGKRKRKGKVIHESLYLQSSKLGRVSNKKQLK